MSKVKPARIIQNANYSFDSLRNAWFRGKKPVNEEDVLVWLIRYAKGQNVLNAGEWAAKALESAKQTPELTTGAFVKARMVRNRNRRTAGKYLFQNWAHAVGIEIVGSLEDFMRRHSLVVARFYNEIARGFACCKKQARIAGRVMRSVFFGWDLRDEEAEAVDAELRARPPADIPPQDHHAHRRNEAMRRYAEFMNKLFKTDS